MGLDPNEIAHFYLQEQAPIQVLGLSLFNLTVILSWGSKDLVPAKVTPDSVLLFKEKEAQYKEQARKGDGRGREGKGREKRRQGRRGSKVTGHSLAFHFNCCTLPYPCISEMLIKGRFPEELSARLEPARFSQIKLVNLQRGHCFSPGEWFWVWAPVFSAGFCSSLLSEGKCCSHPGRRGTGFTSEPAPEIVDKAEMQGFLRKRRRIPTSFHFLAWLWISYLRCFQRMTHPPVSHLRPAEPHPMQPVLWGQWQGPRSLWWSG